MNKPERIIVLGLGNVLAGDDGFGSHAIRFLNENYDFPENCSVFDGGTQGQLLYGIVEEADRLLLADAANLGGKPGELIVAKNEEIPKWLTAGKLDAHQASFAEVLALAEITGVAPGEICLVGFQPLDMTFGNPLSSKALAALPLAIDMIFQQLKKWGVEPVSGGTNLHPFSEEMFNTFRGK